MDGPASQSSVLQGPGGPAHHPGGGTVSAGAPSADGKVSGQQVILAITLNLKIQTSTKKTIKKNPEYILNFVLSILKHVKVALFCLLLFLLVRAALGSSPQISLHILSVTKAFWVLLYQFNKNRMPFPSHPLTQLISSHSLCQECPSCPLLVT